MDPEADTTSACGRQDSSLGPPQSRVSPGASEKASGRRKACNECKQQKLRCDFTAGEVCDRCQRLNLECKTEEGFRRIRKRRRSADLENEIQELRRELHEARNGLANLEPAVPPAQAYNTTNWASTSNIRAMPLSPSYNNPIPAGSITDASPNAGTTLGNTDDSPTASSIAPGLTTRPSIDELAPRRRVSSSVPRPRALGNTALSVEEIDELFLIYITYYHPFLPLVDPSKSPHEYYQSSELLFWSIISVASRRLRSQPTLLPKLARNVTDLLWKTIRSVPYSLMAIQGIALLCTWPFPTSSSTTDPTFMLAGTLLHIGTQMGLHRALDAQDFSKVPTNLSVFEYSEWVRTWEACNIIAQSVSVGCGLPMVTQTYDWPPQNRPRTDRTDAFELGSPFRFHLQIEQFRLRVSSSLAWHILESGQASFTRERLALYRLLNSELEKLMCENAAISPLMEWYLTSARLHLHAFYLFDPSSTDGYESRILSLYNTATNLIEQSLQRDAQETGFFEYYPFFAYQVFVCASFVILKILTNGYFRTIIDVDAATRLLESAIAALRKSSVVNNDLPARLGDVIAFFCALPDPTALGGQTVDDIQLRQVKNRLSMSVVYDCLWTWRKHFWTEENEGRRREGTHNGQDKFYLINGWTKLTCSLSTQCFHAAGYAELPRLQFSIRYVWLAGHGLGGVKSKTSKNS